MTAKKMILYTCLVFILLNACASTPSPTSEPDNSNVAAIAIVDQFYTQINDARNKNDLGKSWTLLSNDTQCNPVNKCELSYFQDRWWNSKVIYILYDCGPNRVVAQERKYPREADPASSTDTPKYWLYRLSDFEGNLMINEMDIIQAPGAECVLVK